MRFQTALGALALLATGCAASTQPHDIMAPQATVDPVEAAPDAELAATVFLVRHFEKVPDGSRDPELTPLGAERADALAALLGDADVTALLHSQYRRTRATLAPLATRTGVALEELPAQDVGAYVERIHAAAAGDVLVVAGHSNTIPVLAEALGVALPGLENGKLPESAYGRLHLIVPGVDGPRGIELRVGPRNAGD